MRMTTLAPPEPVAKPACEPIAGNYFVAVYPPFSAWTPGQVPALHDALNEAPSAAPLGIYVHIPFCQKKCDYCYYLSYIGQNADAVNRYLDAIVREAVLYSQRGAVKDRKISFVYFGGGTPSTLTTAQLGFLGKGLRGLLDWSNMEEITFEVAPRSVRPEFLKALHELGVTRISMGVQSFNDDLLKINGRVHLAKDVIRAYEMIRNAGFNWINLDLMCGLIGETPEQWHRTIQETLKLSPDSVTIYQTEIPYNTQLYRDFKNNQLHSPPASWETKRLRLLSGFDALESAGYSIVSAYNAIKEPELHRFKYQEQLWHGTDMLGLGVASFGYFGGVHFQNEATLEEYFTAINDGKLPVKRAYILDDREQLVRELVLQLKFGNVHVKYFQTKFGIDITEMFTAQLKKLSAEGLLIFSKTEVRLTRAGLLRADRIVTEFYDSKFHEIRYT